MLMLLEFRNHPQAQEGEVYFGDLSSGGFQNLRMTTKRMGTIHIPKNAGIFHSDFFPVFVQRLELEAKGYSIVDDASSYDCRL
ncbi:MAG: hypothetical protein A3D35_03380 [Candidatus Staskawiczbacteria bacterium RIFCSPHIGHO2_02_FULL_34_9]|uniref:Uncharacterized protein n=1 Tax=Candidatus Staskawiczbacteria bacterium RIFCSPHIGHO2_02_FULL_34_9 TaxID=1802206 RepID=A0A1G2I267_9BACT|nr:MAG: hypothetical protein A3D35_03380 [Candidatus Staskawiczbacteria bacterium RIFCSPHIGHO2_02_FULL_34_9]